MANIEISTLTRNNDGNTYIIKDANAIPRSGGAVMTGTRISRVDNTEGLDICGGTSFENGGFVALRGKDTNVTGQKGAVVIGTNNGSSNCDLMLYPNGTATWGSKNVAMQEDVVPRIGGSVMSGNLFRTADDGTFVIGGGKAYTTGASIYMRGALVDSEPGWIYLSPRSAIHTYKYMILKPDGSLTWDGQPIQYTSDQRFKQQISNIDDKLLDAWEDVNPVQFKYNDAVDQKGDNARLHTGYVVQQINEACQKHDVDISEYGLYCHEEYHERTEEVTIENEDGTTKKETKVVEPAKEYYSLRYTETLVVECAYLRRENDKLKQQFKQLEETVNELKSIINCSEFPNS